jgi:hypothetical protein
MTFAVETLTALEDVFARLDPRNDRWGSGFDLDWVFRGVGHEPFALLPTAWRGSDLVAWIKKRDAKILHRFSRSHAIAGSNWIPEERLGIFEQVYAEQTIRNEYVRFADKLGLPLPQSDFQTVDSIINFAREVAKASTGASPDPPHPNLALVQHVGLPTMLLDWSTNPYVALYFACSDHNGHREDGSEFMAVWALKRDAEFTDQKAHRKLGPGLKLFSPLSSNNSFMRSQEGCFSWVHRSGQFFLRDRRWPRVNDVVMSNQLIEIRIPKTLATDISKQLWRLGITPAHMRPTYEGAAEALRRRWQSEGSDDTPPLQGG